MKEKAKELFDKFYKIEPVEPIYIGMDRGQAKQCALICVDEIINYMDKLVGGEVYYSELNYWQEVKQEIEKI
jgi:hypothetical protein